MTLTITLPPEAEEQLREMATREGVDAETAAATMLLEALAWRARDSEEAVTGIQRGLDDFAAGRFRSFEEFAEEQRRKHPSLDQR